MGEKLLFGVNLNKVLKCVKVGRCLNLFTVSRNKIASFLAMTGTVVACTAPIELETRDSEPVIVIYGILTDANKYQSIRITKSSPYFDAASTIPVTDATVTVTSSRGREHQFRYDEDGYYVSTDNFTAAQGLTYRLRVEVDFQGNGNKELYEAETTVLPPVPVDSIGIKRMDIMGFSHYNLYISMQEPPETENYYLYRYFINDTISNDSMDDFIISEDRMYNGSYLDNITVQYFNDATDERFSQEDDEEEERNNRFRVSPGDTVRLQTLNIEAGFYTFISDCSRERRGENPFFGGPPSNIITNISNGGVGYFSSFSINELTTIVPEKSLEKP